MLKNQNVCYWVNNVSIQLLNIRLVLVTEICHNLLSELIRLKCNFKSKIKLVQNFELKIMKKKKRNINKKYWFELK